jgi:hypothetical protein
LPPRARRFFAVPTVTSATASRRISQAAASERNHGLDADNKDVADRRVVLG